SEKAKSLKVGDGLDSDTVVNPLIRESHAERVLNYIDQGEKEGAELIVDGRNKDSSKNHMGATIFDHVSTDMDIWKDEIFGPVLSIVRIKNLDEGIELANHSPYANGAVIYTESGKDARIFREYI